MKQLQRKAILNEYNAGANQYVVHDTTADKWIISQDATVASPVDLLPPIFEGQTVVNKVQVFPSLLEVRQIVSIIDSAFNGTPQTVLADTRYKVSLEYALEKYEGAQTSLGVYAYTTPHALTGNAATDRLNLYTALANKINTHAGNNVEAFVIHQVAFTLGGSATTTTNFSLTPGVNLMPYGASGTQATSNATFKVAGIVITSGTIAGDNAAGTIYLYDVKTSAGVADATAFTTGILISTVTGVDSAGTAMSIVFTTNAVLTQGQGLAIVDDAGYYPARPNPRMGKTGVYTDGSFSMLSPIISRSAVYGRGIGSRMIQDFPAYDLGGQNVVSGDAELFDVNALPVAAYYYTAFVIDVATKIYPDTLGNGSEGNIIQYVLWAKENTQGTAPAQLAADLQSIS
jgi:hypothetical protein